MPDRDLVLGPAAKLGQERGDGLVDVELALVHQDHRHRRGHDDLGEAGQVVHRVRADGSRIVVVGEMAKRLQVREHAVLPHRDHRPRERAGRHRRLHHAVHFLKAVRPEARLRRRGRAQRHLVPRDLEPVAECIESGKRDRNLPAHRILSEDRGHRRALARIGRRRRHVGGDGRDLAQQVGLPKESSTTGRPAACRSRRRRAWLSAMSAFPL
jgi:hypothetical protein